MFFELLKTADKTATETKEVITYKADGNGVKTCKKEHISLAELYIDDSIIGLYAEPIRADYTDDIDVDFLMGYAEGKTQIQVERIYNILSRVQSYAEGGKTVYKSRRDFIRDIVAEGGKVRKIENMVYFYGSKWDRKEGRKTVLRAEEADGSSWEITKTEYDFGKYLMSLEG